MAYTALTNSTHSKWWITGTGAARNRLHDLMIHDCPDGPYYTTAAGSWTASAGDAAEFYHAPTKRPDNVYCAGAKLTEKADNTCIDGGGGGLANGEWCWETVNSRVYVQIAAGDPDGVVTSLYYDWNGSVSSTNFMTEVVEDKIYRIHKSFEIGNGSTATTLTSECEAIYGDQGCNICETQANATFTLGIAHSDSGTTYGRQGSLLYIEGVTGTNCMIADGGTVNIYGSTVFHKTSSSYTPLEFGFDTGTVNIYNSQFYAATPHHTYNNYRNVIAFSVGLTALSMYDVYMAGFREVYIGKIPTLADYVWIHDCRYGLKCVGTVEFPNVKITDVVSAAAGSYSYVMAASAGSTDTVTVLDNRFNMSTLAAAGFMIYNANSVIKEDYTVAIHVSDKDGVDLSGVTVTWLDANANTGNDTTDVNGDVAFQLTARKFTGTSETLTDNNTFTFTVSKAGYETLSIENVTIDAPIDWHLELQDELTNADICTAIWNYANRTLTE